MALHSRETERVLAPMKETIDAAKEAPFQRLKAFRKGRARMLRLANALYFLREGRI